MCLVIILLGLNSHVSASWSSLKRICGTYAWLRSSVREIARPLPALRALAGSTPRSEPFFVQGSHERPKQSD